MTALTERAGHREAAEAFRAGFDPREPGRYAWVVEHAKALYAGRLTDFKELDDKAAAVVNAIAGGAGLLTAGTLVAVGGDKVSPLVAAAALPAVGLAAAAMWLAGRARSPGDVPEPPSVPEAAWYADYYQDRGEAAFLKQWALCLSYFQPVQTEKARLIGRATRLFSLAVLALSLPLVASLFFRPAAERKAEPAASATR